MPTDEAPRKHLRRREREGHARYLTFSCYRGLPLFRNPAIGACFICHLESARVACRFRLYAFVVMPNHVHLLIRPSLPGHPVSEMLWRLKRGHAIEVLSRWRALSAPILARLTTRTEGARFWQAGGGHDRNIFSREELDEKRHYIHENPVRAGLVPNAADWPLSTARWYHRGEDVGVRVNEEPEEDQVGWHG